MRKNIRLYLVGGYLRDLLCSLSSDDYDFAVDGDAINFGRYVADKMRGNFILLDEEHASVRVVCRLEKRTAKLINLDFTKLRSKTIRDDLTQRDFTINALAVELNQSIIPKIIDCTDGISDIKRGVVRAISEHSIIDDPLRMLRAVRIAGELKFIIDKETEVLIQKYPHLLNQSAQERITNELFCILKNKCCASLFLWLDKLNLLTQITSEIEGMRKIPSDEFHHLSLCEHSIATVEILEDIIDRLDEIFGVWTPQIKIDIDNYISADHSRLSVLKLAALLHDIGKPAVFTTDLSGRHRFFGHELVGAKMAKIIANRLKLSKKEGRMLVTIIKNHMRPGHLVENDALTERAVSRFFRDMESETIPTLLHSLADRFAARGVMITENLLQRHKACIISLITKFYEPSPLLSMPLLRGRDLIENFNLPPGPLFGELLHKVEEAKLDKEITSREEALKLVEGWLSK